MQEGKFLKGCCRDGADRALLEGICELLEKQDGRYFELYLPHDIYA